MRKIPLAVLVLFVLGCAGNTKTAGEAFSVPALLDDDDEITLDSPADVPARRQALIDLLWGGAGLPDWLPAEVDRGVTNPIQSTPMTNLARVDRLVISMDQGIANETFHFIPENPNGRLVIVQGGHAYGIDVAGLGEAIAALVAEGYGVLGATMVCYSAFPCPGVPSDVSPHDYLVPHVVPPEGDVLKYFFEHLVVSLNYLDTQSVAGGFAPYHDRSMVGLSGGGWSTVVYAALDPRVTASFPCSGSKPMYLRHCDYPGGGCIDGYEGDAEQVYFPLFKHVAGYLDLYAMGAAGPGRTQVQTQIRHDACCFGEDQYEGAVPGLSWDQAVRAYEQKIQGFLGQSQGGDQGWYRFEIDETASGTHEVSPTTLAQVILSELDGDRRPFAAASASEVYAKGEGDHLAYGLPAWTATSSPMVGTPAVVAAGDGTEIFLRDPTSALVHVTRGSGFVTETWPGTIASDPAAVASGDDIDVVAVRADTHLWHWAEDDGFISMAIADPETPVVGTPLLFSAKEGWLDVLVRRLDGGVQHVYRHGVKGWSTERASAGPFRGFPAGVLTGDGMLRLYARSVDDTLVEVASPGAGGDWALSQVAQDVGVAAATIAGSASAFVDPSSGDVIVLARSPSGDLTQLVRGATSGWTQQGIDRPEGPPPSKGTASLTFSPVAVPGGVFARAVEGGVWFHASPGGWTWEGGVVR